MKYALVLAIFATAAFGSVCPQPSPTAGILSPLHAPFLDYVWLDSMSGPPDTIFTDTFIDVRGRAMLHASQDAPGTRVQIRFRRIGSGASRHYDTFDLAPGESVTVEWRVELLPESAQYFASESVMGSMSAESSYVTWQFWVLLRHGGVEDFNKQSAIGKRSEPSVLRHMPAGAVAFDALGRQVLAPKTGVYFVRATPTALPRKVLLVR